MASTKKLKITKEFEQMRDMAELKALSKASLIEKLSDKDYKRMMALKKNLFK